MKFRDTHCAWCTLKNEPIEGCLQCSRFRKYELNEDISLDASGFCSQCGNSSDAELKVFCETNRRLQEGSGEPFDCYKFSPEFQDRGCTQTHVVTVFLYHQSKVCVVRRSQKVGTYRGRWSGISGYLEGDASSHFKKELQEETSLDQGDYTLVRHADTVVIPDEEQSRIWCIHPFLCEVHDPSRISLDWENTELRWIDPPEIKGLETVPGLWEVFERVSRLPLEHDISAYVTGLKEDRESGARQLAFTALDFLGRVVRGSNAAATITLLDDLFYACHEISMARPSMGIIATTLELFLNDMKTAGSLDILGAQRLVKALILKHMKEMDSALNAAIEHLEHIVPDKSRILLHSYSSSLIHALPLLKEKQCFLIVTESRPGLEGRTTAQMASDMGLKVKLVADACAGHELKSVDVVLMGADTIEQDGSVINKAGSSLIAMAAYILKKKVYFIGELRKIRSQTGNAELEEYDPDEVWDKPPQGVEVGNLYFDRTSPQFISGIVLERGVVKTEQIKDIARSIFPLDMCDAPGAC